MLYAASLRKVPLHHSIVNLSKLFEMDDHSSQRLCVGVHISWDTREGGVAEISSRKKKISEFKILSGVSSPWFSQEL